jgi:hypothetical protein
MRGTPPTQTRGSVRAISPATAGGGSGGDAGKKQRGASIALNPSLIERDLYVPHMGQAQVGQLNSAGQPHEKPCAQLLFKSAYLSAHRALGNPHFTSSVRKAQ